MMSHDRQNMIFWIVHDQTNRSAPAFSCCTTLRRIMRLKRSWNSSAMTRSTRSVFLTRFRTWILLCGCWQVNVPGWKPYSLDQIKLFDAFVMRRLKRFEYQSPNPLGKTSPKTVLGDIWAVFACRTLLERIVNSLAGRPSTRQKPGFNVMLAIRRNHHGRSVPLAPGINKRPRRTRQKTWSPLDWSVIVINQFSFFLLLLLCLFPYEALPFCSWLWWGFSWMRQQEAIRQAFLCLERFWSLWRIHLWRPALCFGM